MTPILGWHTPKRARYVQYKHQDKLKYATGDLGAATRAQGKPVGREARGEKPWAGQPMSTRAHCAFLASTTPFRNYSKVPLLRLFLKNGKLV
jgi:hypothetical protein